MLFNSLHFAFFFILTTAVYFLLPHRLRWFFLLAISCYFYAVFVPVYILILAFTIVVDYFAGRLIEDHPQHKGPLLWASIVVNVGFLSFFKYYNFLNENLTLLLGLGGASNPIPALDIILPVGLSFHTFQAMSYTIEVYRGKQKAERHFGIYALYVMYYPQLVAGPIERPQNMLHQFYKKVDFNYDRVVSGLRLMLWGLFKKVVIADRLSIYVDAVYNNADHHSWISSVVATIFFAFQIYCDFSGYSSIALGASRVLGIDLMLNFNRPYLASSIRDFWSRWHISLSTWFRDYLYIPLGGSRVRLPRHLLNLMIVFMVSGLWHGASWAFVIWGGLHGFYLIVEHLLRLYVFKDHKDPELIPAWRKVPGYVLTFALACFAWIFFRANNVHDAFTIISNIFTLKPGGLFIGYGAGFLYSWALIIFLLLAEINDEFFSARWSMIWSTRPAVRMTGYALLLLLMLLIGVFNGGQFIYFQF